MNHYTLNPLFDPVAHAVGDAHLVAFDGCHKIYVAMDEDQANWFRKSDYIVVEGDDVTMLSTVLKWWDESCFLRFVTAVNTPDEWTPEYVTLVPQECPRKAHRTLVPQGADIDTSEFYPEDDDI